MNKSPVQNNNPHLFEDIKQLIDEARNKIAQTVNIGLTATYWNIGKRINDDILKNRRAEYGEQILPTLSAKLVKEYGNGFSVSALTRMCAFNEKFPDFQIVATLWQQLSWSHFKLIIPLKTNLERDFYAQMCRVERWSVRTLRKKIDSMLFDRTAISKKPDELAKLELKMLEEDDKLSPDLICKDHYVLDFLDLGDTYSELDLEAVIIT